MSLEASDPPPPPGGPRRGPGPRPGWRREDPAAGISRRNLRTDGATTEARCSRASSTRIASIPASSRSDDRDALVGTLDRIAVSFAAILDDAAGLDAYLDHPLHKAVYDEHLGEMIAERAAAQLPIAEGSFR